MQEDIWKIASTLILGALLGATTGYFLHCFLIASFGIIIWQIHRLNKLNRWVGNPTIKSVPDTDGQIYLILRKLAKRDQKAKSRQRQFTGYLSQVRKAIGALPDAIVLIDDSSKIEWANNNALTLLGIRWPADNGLRLADLVRSAELEALLKKDPPSSEGVEVASATKRDTVLNVKCLAYAENLRMVIARDVTRLVRTNRMQRDFVANVSHELKTPLTVLRGYLEILQDSDKLSKDLVKPIEQMSTQSQRMELIVGDLLFLAKLESTELADTDETVDMTQLVNSVLENLQPLISEKEHRIKTAIDPSLQLLGSNSELHSAISNLVTNAIYYTPAKGRVEITWKAADGGATLSVRDNGDGIEAHHLERLTQRFYRVDTNRSRDGGGTGLGLAIVKHVLQRHSSELQIKSKVGEGSKFSCFFSSSQVISAPSSARANDQAKVTRIY